MVGDVGVRTRVLLGVPGVAGVELRRGPFVGVGEHGGVT